MAVYDRTEPCPESYYCHLRRVPILRADAILTTNDHGKCFALIEGHIKRARAVGCGDLDPTVECDVKNRFMRPDRDRYRGVPERSIAEK
jgi:hypothetical protein